MNPESNDVAKPWYHQPWMWLVVGLPLASVIASLSMVAISVKHRDELVRDDWYKAGRAINQDLKAEQHAQELGLAGTLVLEPAVPAVSITLTTDGTALPDRLQLVLVHSTLANEDMTVVVERSADGAWHGTLPRLPMGKRHLMLEPLQSDASQPRWRLRAGDVIFQGEPVALRAAG